MISHSLLELLRLHASDTQMEEPRRSEIAHLFSQTHPSERIALYLTARHYFSGSGSILDIGTAAGGSTYCLAAGVADGTYAMNTKVHGFDLFRGYSVSIFASRIKEAGKTFATDTELFDWVTEKVSSNVERHTVDLLSEPSAISAYGPAEIVHIDAAKSLALWRAIFSEISKLVIPGRTLWILQDFERCRLPFQVYTIGALLEYGEIVGGAELGTVYFRFNKCVPDAKRAQIEQDDFTLGQKVDLLKTVRKIMSERFLDIYGTPEFFEDCWTTLEAYVYLMEGDVDEARRLFSATRPDFRSTPDNLVYSKEIVELGGFLSLF